MLHKAEAGVELALVPRWVETHRQPAQPRTERGEFVIFLYRDHTRIQQQTVQAAHASGQFAVIRGGKIKRQRAAVEFVAVLQPVAHLLTVFFGVLRFDVLADGAVAEAT
ncbi:Uncharacterised protein [Citrobacter koseri]|uniref:Uncharacterized protein n=1 Tax=Citrobacter koseri TaxID=545 RepID=A0A3S4IX34_CITKO|nr:Uncharacterised protein [Citrobacter koseri]